ncbi:Zinc finger BED domain-containing protein DAYSLEEPER [Striga hermonthica]|uniref:Zinc finger BED domain-containing protein DAYSLEEPER n=1 Tax=Striga hermonthica TaxID=68872 RepID=A0A9N7NJC4_STRHE|nr:Zinc finger BED domain-containing protein DAYSLEEPER [Striga hermonthica]
MEAEQIVDLDDDVPSPNINESNANPTKKAKTYDPTSGVWEFFDRLGTGSDGKPRAACKACKKKYIAGGSRYGTSSITRHMNKCQQLKSRYQSDVSNLLIDHAGKMRSRKISQKVLREKIAQAIIRHDLPFSFVEYDGIKDVLKYCNPDVRTFSRNTASSDVLKLYTAKKKILRKMLADVRSRICLTSDVWTACTSEGYICLTAHFIDAEWKLNNFILSFSAFPPPHSGTELARKVFDLLREWGIDRKIFSITLDNAKSNDNMQDILREQLCLQDSLLCEGQFFHIRCSAHVLNLIVQKGIKVAGDALHKIRESVKYVKGSEGRMKAFEECAKQVDIQTGIHLRLDVTTRWNSTYMMLESALRYRRAFTSLSLCDRNYKHCPSVDDWSRGQKMFEFLRPFFDITKLMSGSSYPTSNVYFTQVWKIQCLLLKNVNNDDVVIKEMVKEMMGKFDDYWKEYSVVLAMGAVLDPRIKFQLLEMCYDRVDPNEDDDETLKGSNSSMVGSSDSGGEDEDEN